MQKKVVLKKIAGFVFAGTLALSAFVPQVWATSAMPQTQAQPQPSSIGLEALNSVYYKLEFESDNLMLNSDGATSVKLKVKNLTGTSQDIEIIDISLPSQLTRLQYSTDSLRLTGLESGKTGELTYRVLVPKDQAEGVFPVSYTVNVSGHKAVYTSYFRFVSSDASNTNTDLRISNISIPEKVSVGKAFDLSFRVANLGSAEAQSVTISLDLPEGFVNLSQNTFVLPKLSPFAVAEYKVSLKASEDVTEKFHDIKINATPAASSDKNASILPASVYTGTYVVGGKSAQKATGKVLVYLESFKFTDENGEETKHLVAGQNYTLDFKVRNTSPYALRNVKVNFIEESGAITPNDASASFYEPSVPAGGYLFETLPITVASNANAQNMVPKIGLYFEYAADQSGESIESMSVRVEQKTKIDTQVNFMPKNRQVLQGEMTDTTFQLINMGRTDLRNLRVFIKDLDENKITTEESSHFLGNFNQGSKASADFSLNFMEVGTTEVVYVVEYEEPTGKLVQEEHRFSYTVDEMVLPDMSGIEEMPIQESSSFPWMPVLVSLLVVLSLVTFFVYKKIKKKQKQATLEMED